MSTLQAWLIVGIPALAVTAGLFAGRSVVRSTFGYLALALTFLFFLVYVDSPVSAGAIGVVFFMLVALGRGGDDVESEAPGHGVPVRMDDPNVDDPRHV